MQKAVGDPPELEPAVPVPASGADDQQVGLVRSVQEGSAGCPSTVRRRTSTSAGNVVPCCPKLLGRPLLVCAGGLNGRQGVPPDEICGRRGGGLVRRAP